MNIINQSIDISLNLLPKVKKSRTSRNKFFHFAFGYHKSKLLAIGQNNPEKTHTKAHILAKRFNLDNNYPYLHAETDLISRLWSKFYIDDSLTVVVVRLNKHGHLRNSKPCIKCSIILEALGVTQVYWSTDDGFKQS